MYNTPALALSPILYSYDHGASRELLLHLHEAVTDVIGTVVVAAIVLRLQNI